VVSPDGALAYMVAAGSSVWSRPSECPASCVTVFCTSIRTQPVSPDLVQGSPSTVVNVSLFALLEGASFISMSLSRISPVELFEVVVVVAMIPSPCSQQS